MLTLIHEAVSDTIINMAQGIHQPAAAVKKRMLVEFCLDDLSFEQKIAQLF